MERGNSGLNLAWRLVFMIWILNLCMVLLFNLLKVSRFRVFGIPRQRVFYFVLDEKDMYRLRKLFGAFLDTYIPALIFS